jgi:hypothetical protein
VSQDQDDSAVTVGENIENQEAPIWNMATSQGFHAIMMRYFFPVRMDYDGLKTKTLPALNQLRGSGNTLANAH